jgi:hypothetical protein
VKPLTPEELRAALGIDPEGGFAEDQAALLQHQLARADALRDQPIQQHSTGLGGALGGLGSIFDAYNGKRQSDEAQAKLQALSQSQAKNAMLIGPKSMGTDPNADPWAMPPPRGTL